MFRLFFMLLDFFKIIVTVHTLFSFVEMNHVIALNIRWWLFGFGFGWYCCRKTQKSNIHLRIFPACTEPTQYNRLHAKYVAGILKEAAIRLKRLPNLNQASTAISKQVTICGDLHGKLDDLLVVFHKVSKS